jgi:integrase
MRCTRASKGSKSWFVTALAESGLDPMAPHDLRHTGASLAISSGANVKAVQRMLGLASAAMTLDLYADLFDDDLTALADGIDDAAHAANVFELWGSAAS